MADSDAPLMTAVWRNLVFFNYEADPALLSPRLPPDTELDTWHGRALVSLIGLRFLDLRILGVPALGHRAFEQINFRFYVRRPAGDGQWRRGVVFIRETVPRRLMVSVARLWFGEPYAYRRTRHRLEPGALAARSAFTVSYEWKDRGRWEGFSAQGAGRPATFASGSVEEFLTERHWGYNRRPDHRASEFRVRHVPWLVWPLREPRLEGDVTRLFGAEWSEPLSREPHSALMAEGSDVAIYPPRPAEEGDFPGAAA